MVCYFLNAWCHNILSIFYIPYHNTCNFNHSYFLFPKWKHMFSVSFYVYYTYLSTRYTVSDETSVLMLLLFVSVVETESRSLPIWPFWGLFEKNIFLMFHFFHEKNVHLHVFDRFHFIVSVKIIKTIKLFLIIHHVSKCIASNYFHLEILFFT